MTNPTTNVSWQERRKELNLTDEQIVDKVHRRIRAFNSKQKEFTEFETALEVAKSASKPKPRDIRALEEAIKDTRTEIDQMNTQLCSDMQRMVKDAEKIAEARQKIKQTIGKGKTPAATNSADNLDLEVKADESSATGTEQNKGSAVEGGQGSNEPTGNSIPLIITGAKRVKLYELNYTEADVDKMTPEKAEEILSANTTAGPSSEPDAPADNNTDNKTSNYEQTQPNAAAESTASTEVPALQQSGQENGQKTGVLKQMPVPAIKKTPKPASEKSKSNTGQIIVGIGLGVGVILATIFGIRYIRNKKG